MSYNSRKNRHQQRLRPIGGENKAFGADYTKPKDNKLTKYKNYTVGDSVTVTFRNPKEVLRGKIIGFTGTRTTNGGEVLLNFTRTEQMYPEGILLSEWVAPNVTSYEQAIKDDNMYHDKYDRVCVFADCEIEILRKGLRGINLLHLTKKP
tara:strand:+ start:2789 stop:3238 length:450 start_codon:yes stop_codon:yes gene_type:complete